jgi:replicative DNA helicase
MNALAKIDDAAIGNVDIEQELLGALIMSDRAIDLIERDLSAGDFSDSLLSQIYETIVRVYHERGTVSPALVIAGMGGDRNTIIADGITLGQYVAKLAAAACIASHLRAYAKQIREFSDRRKLLALAETVTQGVQANQPAADIAGLGIELLDEIAAQASAGSTPQASIREANEKSLARMQYGMQNPGQLAGISWGLAGLDQKTGGLKRGELFILAGRPGMGKTALAICIAAATASAGEPTFLSSLEMGDVSVSDRGLANTAYDRFARIPYYDIANGTVTDAQARRVIEAERLQRDWPLHIDPAPGLTVSQIAARARRHKQNLERKGQRLGLVIVDHMHIVKPSNRYSGARVNEVGEISAALKGLAKELDIPVLALAQLSRALESREDKRPTMADLRDSGTIEQDADAIIFVYREAYYLERETSTTPEREARRQDRLIDARDQLEAIVAKQPRAAIIRQGRGGGPAKGTLDWVVDQYKAESADWKKLKPASREIYNRRLDYLQSRYGAADLSTFTERGVRRIRNNLKDRPSVADATVDMIGRLWRFAKEHLDMEEIGANPAAEVASIHTQHKSAPAWPEELCAKFEASENPRLRRAY